jgi:glycerol-1-phosphate dehydrogenase [NAD(P)+]
MLRPTQIAIPTLVRVKQGAIDRLGIYLRRGGHRRVMMLISQGFPASLAERVSSGLRENDVDAVAWNEVADNSLNASVTFLARLPTNVTAIVGVGGGKALDVAKHLGFLARLPYYAVPTSLSNDGFSSPQSSLIVEGKRRSIAAAMPFAVVIDTVVCLAAPRILTLSGVGDLVAKFTAVHDWRSAFHNTGEPVDDFAALLSDGSIHALLGHPILDLDGIRLLATSLLLNGIAMEICGSSRPASGSEHLISHALDAISVPPRMHGLQVGIASYIISCLQGANTEAIAGLFDAVGFWDAVAREPFRRSEWLEAVQRAPSIK